METLVILAVLLGLPLIMVVAFFATMILSTIINSISVDVEKLILWIKQIK